MEKKDRVLHKLQLEKEVQVAIFLKPGVTWKKKKSFNTTVSRRFRKIAESDY